MNDKKDLTLSRSLSWKKLDLIMSVSVCFYVSVLSIPLVLILPAYVLPELSYTLSSFCSSLSPPLFLSISSLFSTPFIVSFLQKVMLYGTSALLIESGGMMAELYSVKHMDGGKSLKV